MTQDSETTTAIMDEIPSCIICLDDMGAVPDVPGPETDLQVAAGDDEQIQHPSETTTKHNVAVIKPCNHFLHDGCLRIWAQKANSCPFCRQAFNVVHVLDSVNGTFLSEYAVEDKKQVAAFDLNSWVEENPEEEEESIPCPVCDSADQEDVLLLCDGCDAAYHTHCIGLDSVPRGDWYCIECAHRGVYDIAATGSPSRVERERPRRRTSTRASRRRDRREQGRGRVRNEVWSDTWNQVSHRIHSASGVDIDFGDNTMQAFRDLQRRATAHQWLRRLQIADRQGARNVFRANVPREVRTPTPPTPTETVEESRAWGAFERAKKVDTKPPRGRKRAWETRSATASPGEGPSEERQEPERKLKRPRTRRVLDRPEASAPPTTSPSRPQNSTRRPSPPQITNAHRQPSFLSSLLKEVEMATPSDDERRGRSAVPTTVPNRVTSPSINEFSPVTSPATSSHSTPRALSITPPPHLHSRSRSPLPLTSRVEPIFPPADYSPNRSPSSRRRGSADSRTPEIRQPRPCRRERPAALPTRHENTSPGPISPVRASLSAEAKEGISRIVKSALAPHWQSAKITKEQYSDINRDVSRKLYEIIADRNLDEREKHRYENVAKSEVAYAVRTLTAAA